MNINTLQARRLLELYLDSYDQIYLEGHFEDAKDWAGVHDQNYWEPEELEAVQRLLALAGEMQKYEGKASRNNLKFKVLDPNGLPPERSKELDAGYDISSAEYRVIDPGESALIETGIAIQTPPGTFAAVHPRSGLAARYRVTVLNAPGTIDEGYRGEVKVNLINHGGLPFVVGVGQRIAQLVIQKYETPNVLLVEELSDTERGTQGHGSTGK